VVRYLENSAMDAFYLMRSRDIKGEALG